MPEIRFKTKIHDARTASREELLEQIDAVHRHLVLVAKDFAKRIATIYDHEVLIAQLLESSRSQRKAWEESRIHLWSEFGRKCNRIIRQIERSILSVLNGIKMELDEDKASWFLLNVEQRDVKELKRRNIDEYSIERREFSVLLAVAKDKLEMAREYTPQELESEAKIIAIQEKLAELIRRHHPHIIQFRELIQLERQALSNFAHEKGKKFDPQERGFKHEPYLQQLVQRVNALLIQEKKSFYDPFNDFANQQQTPIDLLCKVMQSRRRNKAEVGIDDINRVMKTYTDPDEAVMLVAAVKSNPDLFDKKVCKQIDGVWAQAKKDMNSMKTRAFFDPLIKIKNRHSFEEEFVALLKERKTLTLILIDIDKFKDFNDTYGHPIGDKVLVEVGSIIKQALKRSCDEVYRIGGEEIAVILAGMDFAAGSKKAEDIRAAVENHPMTDYRGKMIKHVTISLGLISLTDYSLVEPFGYNVGQLKSMIIKQADKQLYEAKNSGRNNVKAKIFDPTVKG